MRKIFTRNFKNIALLIVFIALHQFLTPFVFSQSGGIGPGEDASTNPKIRDNIVTASVPDVIPPSAPILISPPDESILNDATPSFVWQQSTDNIGVDHYELYIDGLLAYGSIPITSTSNSEYTLTYDGGSGNYTLTPNDPIANGPHTWYVMVYDAVGNNNTSVTWDFIIDTQAPAFVIETIGPLATNISAGDIGSVPEDPIELEDNEPLFTGSGEANASVQVTVQIPGQSNQIITFDIAPDGTWSFQLGILPRDEVITLDFVITDEAGNISVITNLKILIILDVIVFPPTPTPTPIITPGPTPPGEPSVTPTPLPAPSPIIVIPLLPPKEILELIKRELTSLIPEPILELISYIPEQISIAVSQITQQIAPIGVLVATAAVPVFSLLALLLQLGQQISWDFILKVLQALGLIPPQEPQGMVFDAKTNKPVAFALLTITSTDKNLEERLVETAVTDIDGIYQGITLPTGKYVITVSHQDYIFPTKQNRPNYFNIEEFYKGEEFEVTTNRRQKLFLIPMDKIVQTEIGSTFKKTMRGLIRKFRFIDLFWPLFILSILITLYYPTWINLLLLSLYSIILIKRLIKSFDKPTISGYVTTIDQQPVENAIVRISDPKKGELVSIVNTNEQGYHASYLDPNKYQIQITKSGLVWDRQGSQLSFEEVDVTKERKTVDAVMKEIKDIYKELFGDL
jgi:hypothetical protein